MICPSRNASLICFLFMDKYIDHETFYEDERRIMKSGVRDIFTPHIPIDKETLFKGRNYEVRQILSTLNTPGQHVLLFGERGVGKSSLANISSQNLINLTNQKLIIKRCSKSDTFSSIVEKVLDLVGVDIKIINSTSGGQISILNGVFSVEKKVERNGNVTQSLSPSWVMEKIKDLKVLLLVDEFDAIQNESDKHKIAELIKLLSDECSAFKIFVVGIAESAGDLTAGHPSVQRCLKEIQLRKMSYDELKAIVVNGAEQLNLEFDRSALLRIVRLSSGYPNFTHLLALKSAEDAILENRTTITADDVNRAIERAISDCENSLKQKYDDSIRSATSADFYKRILYSAALCSDEFIYSKDIRHKYQTLFDEGITQQKLNNYLVKLVSSSNDKILRRLAKGVYRFSDPRMSPYIRLVQYNMYSPNEE